MIGVTSLARFAGVFGWPAVFPSFAKAAWLGIVPEFNPFKYNSFPVNGARQSSLVARTLQAQITRYAEAGKLAELPPIVTFQSVVDFTVSTRAIVDALYVQLPANGSELVLFDINRAAQLGPLLRAGPQTVLGRLLPAAPRTFRTAVVTNEAPGQSRMVEITTEAGSTDERRRPIDATYPSDVFSLSHLALPFPMSDPLYGMTPDDSEDFGVNLGAIAARGERGTLIVSIDSLVRTSSNPFFDYMSGRIDEGIARPAKPAMPVGGPATPREGDGAPGRDARIRCGKSSVLPASARDRGDVGAPLQLGEGQRGVEPARVVEVAGGQAIEDVPDVETAGSAGGVSVPDGVDRAVVAEQVVPLGPVRELVDAREVDQKQAARSSAPRALASRLPMVGAGREGAVRIGGGGGT